MREKKFDYDVPHRCDIKINTPYDNFQYWCMNPAPYHIRDGAKSFWICEEHFEFMKTLDKMGDDK